jgi:hypothetical protein
MPQLSLSLPNWWGEWVPKPSTQQQLTKFAWSIYNQLVDAKPSYVPFGIKGKLGYASNFSWLLDLQSTHVVLDDEPSKELAFRRCPSLPDQSIENSRARALCSVS